MSLIVVSCTRDLTDLELATNPTTPDVFLDGFSGGLDYAAFAGSVLTAFNVVTDIKYKGTSSMQISVPSVDDPAGAFAGGAYFTSSGRDLSGYDALTFWARATQPATVDVIGFGNDFAESKYTATLQGVPMTTNWKKYYIPIPDPSKLTDERGMFFYSEGPEEGKGYTFWIDEVQFEKLGTIGNPRPSILEMQDQNISAEIGDQPRIGGIFTTFNLPTGVDQRVETNANYLTFDSSDPSVASVAEDGLVSVIGSGTTTISAKLLDIDASGSLTIESSGVAAKPNAPAPAPIRSQDSVISMFSNAYQDVTVDTWNPFWDGSTTENNDIQVDGDDVKQYKNLNFVGILTESAPIDATSMTHFHIDLWTPNATDAGQSFKVLIVDFGSDGSFGGGDDSSHELSFTAPLLESESWVSIDVPLSSFTGLTSRSVISQLVLSGDLPTVYVDNLYYYNAGMVVSSGPEQGAPNPSNDEADVISIFSDSYNNVSGTNFNPDWGQGTQVSETTILGNNTLFYSGLDYQGTELEANLDVSEMTHLHIDYWTSNSSALNAFLISPGPSETGTALSVPTTGWSSVDIPLSDFSDVDLMNIIQFKFDGNGDIYLDNIYFYKEADGMETEPSTAAPDPSRDQGDVISLFSDAYTNVENTNLNPDWGQATQVSEVSIQGNNTLLYGGLNYQGMELGSSQNVSEMTHLSIDIWTVNSSTLKVFLISPGPVETAYDVTVPTSGWSTLEIPLSEFSPVDLADVFQLKWEGNGDIYIDNIYFYK